MEDLIIRYESDEEFFDRSIWRYYAAGLSASNVHNQTVAVTGVSLRVTKTDNVHVDAAVAHNAAISMAKVIFPCDHFYNHMAALQLLDVSAYKVILPSSE